MRASIRQVAELAQVSSMTVSNVLRGVDARTSPATRERVLWAARELSYIPVPQPTTQGRHVATHTIGVIFDEIDAEDVWGTRINNGLLASARKLGYDLLMMLRAPAQWMLDQEELQFLDRRGDGLIFCSPRDRSRVFSTLVQHDIPVVSCFIGDVPEGVATVVLDDIGSMRQATEYVIARGHANILHVAGHGYRSDFRARRRGYEDAMRAAGLEPSVVGSTSREDMGWLALTRQILAEGRVTAVVCASNYYSMPVLELARELGLEVPGDLSVIATDDQPEAEQAGLTTFGFSCAQFGQAALDAVLGLLQGSTAAECSRVIPVQLIERDSVAGPRTV